jgi:hyperosmotically inducible periplasmic protein
VRCAAEASSQSGILLERIPESTDSTSIDYSGTKRCDSPQGNGIREALRPFTLFLISHTSPMNLRRSVIVPLLLLLPASLIADPATDRKIEDAASASYNFRTIFEKQVSMKAEDGVVTLHGTVLDQDQKTLAEETVRGLPGVREIKNQLTVASTGEERSDGWIALKIRSVLLLRANVSATDTDVSVRDGNVVLGGTAESAAQKELTETYAREVEGVKSVENKITVREPSAAAQVAGAERTVGEKIDDTSISAQVKYALLTHRSTSALKTNVDTKNGVVAISGNAASETEKELVSKLASSVRGVASVDNRMSIRVSE